MSHDVQLPQITFTIPDWKAQGMMTFTLPYRDSSVRPNVIVTIEELPEPIDIYTYFERIKASVEKRAIRNLRITDEREVYPGGARGMQMICEWDIAWIKCVANIKKVFGPDCPDEVVNELANPEEPRWVAALDGKIDPEQLDDAFDTLRRIHADAAQERQIVRQLQVSAVEGTTALNITASLPAEAFEEMLPQILAFIETIQFRGA